MFSTDWCAKKLNSSVLLSASRKDSCQFPGVVFEGATQRRMPFPRISLAVDFKLSSTYTSQMMSIRSTFRSCALMYSRNTCVAYSWNVFTSMGFSMLIRAAPSSMMTSTDGASPRVVQNFSKHSTMSDFVENLIFPCKDNDGRYK